MHGKTKGPFHGLPISIKDNFNIVGKDSSIGIASLVNKPAAYNSTIIDIILESGAVLYVKTNVPTAVMLPETVNNVFGRTVNPLNRSLTPGGSSGGEAALIAFGASRIGLGSDIGNIQQTLVSTVSDFLQEDPSVSQPRVLDFSQSALQPGGSHTVEPAPA